MCGASRRAFGDGGAARCKAFWRGSAVGLRPFADIFCDTGLLPGNHAGVLGAVHGHGAAVAVHHYRARCARLHPQRGHHVVHFTLGGPPTPAEPCVDARPGGRVCSGLDGEHLVGAAAARAAGAGGAHWRTGGRRGGVPQQGGHAQTKCGRGRRAQGRRGSGHAQAACGSGSSARGRRNRGRANLGSGRGAWSRRGACSCRGAWSSHRRFGLRGSSGCPGRGRRRRRRGSVRGACWGRSDGGKYRELDRAAGGYCRRLAHCQRCGRYRRLSRHRSLGRCRRLGRCRDLDQRRHLCCYRRLGRHRLLS
mmetsp:Transcript_41961/g.125634  ORF Transcript_41961/g.125634 Transcript_41961/m.125634 type:complete len:307 (-) Transcript_41961:2250-3170(-)